MRCKDCPALEYTPDICRIKDYTTMIRFKDGSMGCRKRFWSIIKRLAIMLILTISLIGCYSSPTPIIIRSIPQADVSSDMTVDEYMQSSTQWAVEITAYIKELINQIRHKVPYIDLRKNEE